MVQFPNQPPVYCLNEIKFFLFFLSLFFFSFNPTSLEATWLYVEMEFNVSNLKAHSFFLTPYCFAIKTAPVPTARTGSVKWNYT